MTTLPKGIYLPRDGKLHFSCYTTWTKGNTGKAEYMKRFFHGHDNLKTKALEFGAHIMYLMEFDGQNELVKDIPRHPHIEYDLNTMIGDIPINTHPDSIDIDNTLALYEYKTALQKSEHKESAVFTIDPCSGEMRMEIKKCSWNSRMVYKQKQISFYQTCVRELKGTWNPEENFIVEIPTKRIDKVVEDGVEWDIVGIENKYMEVTRDTDENGNYLPTILHRRVVTEKEMDVLKDDIIRVGHEISDAYKKFLEEQLTLDW